MIKQKWIFAVGVLVGLFSVSLSSAEMALEGEVKISSGVSPADLLVYIANPPPAPKPPSGPTAIMDQRNQAYHPHVMAVVVGTTVKFLNSDRLTHNIFSQSPPKIFDLGRIAPNTSAQLAFEKPGVIELLCGFHSRMLAYIHVMEHPYFAVPDSKGRFAIKGVPPGTYQLRIWHEQSSGASKEAKVAADQSSPVQLYFPK